MAGSPPGALIVIHFVLFSSRALLWRFNTFSVEPRARNICTAILTTQLFVSDREIPRAKNILKWFPSRHVFSTVPIELFFGWFLSRHMFVSGSNRDTFLHGSCRDTCLSVSYRDTLFVVVPIETHFVNGSDRDPFLQWFLSRHMFDWYLSGHIF